MVHFLHFGMGMNILCHILGQCGFALFDFIGITVKSMHEISEETLNFGFLNILETDTLFELLKLD